MTAAEVWTRLPLRTRLWLTAADIWLNVQCGGLDGETLSERAAWAKAQGNPLAAKVCDVLDAIDPGHSDRALITATRRRADVEELF